MCREKLCEEEQYRENMYQRSCAERSLVGSDLTRNPSEKNPGEAVLGEDMARMAGRYYFFGRRRARRGNCEKARVRRNCSEEVRISEEKN